MAQIFYKCDKYYTHHKDLDLLWGAAGTPAGAAGVPGADGGIFPTGCPITKNSKLFVLQTILDSSTAMILVLKDKIAYYY